MFWNLVTVNYEKYNIHHYLYFLLLLLYSLFGGLMFLWIEGKKMSNNSLLSAVFFVFFEIKDHNIVLFRWLFIKNDF